MAQKVSITLVDDIDESVAVETVSFGLDGTSYEIDLNDTHASELRDALAPYVGHARKSGSTRGARKSTSPSRRASADDGPSAKDVREWARENGMDVPDRGRVSTEVREAYDAAH
ncbi:Lsr2 family protein [uncultured Nocardioides sp.]|uniref:histone-like nucleoid-structuring protein Lsr2 n=1 Tax=uncultured Nocardioides sp. TaxID=198441 RepID=UPI00260D17E5|nr:Lsr2 family protein [uncultured Nocardioides sp.]